MFFQHIYGEREREKKQKKTYTLPETNIAHENPLFPCKYHQKGGFSMAMLVLGRVKLDKFWNALNGNVKKTCSPHGLHLVQMARISTTNR